MNLAIELVAATTLGSSMAMGMAYFLWLMIMDGMTPIGRASFPIAFSIILSAQKEEIPPDSSNDSYITPPTIEFKTFLLSSMLNL